MLIDYNYYYMPQDTSVIVAEFIISQLNSNNRYHVIFDLPVAPRYHTQSEERFTVETAYFTNQQWWLSDKIIMFRHQRTHCRATSILAYALDHIVAIFPNAMRRQKKQEPGVLKLDWQQWIGHLHFNTHREGLRRWATNNNNVQYFDNYSRTIQEKHDGTNTRSEPDAALRRASGGIQRAGADQDAGT